MRAHFRRARKISAFWLVFTLFLWLPAPFASATDELDRIPDGYQAGRPEAVYGSYDTPVNPHARAFQDRAKALEQKVFGLAKLNDLEKTEKSTLVYLLEKEILKLHLDITENPGHFASEFEQKAVLNRTLEAYRSLCYHRDQMFEDMVRFIDEKFPGPNGGQFRTEGKKPGRVLYYPNFRSDTLLSEADRAKKYKALKDKFLAGGGSLEEIKKFSPELLEGEQTHWFEYVVRERGGLYVTKGKAGHVLLGQGKPVAAAGQIVLVMDKFRNKPSMAILTNASGNIKPDMISVQEEVGEFLMKELGLPPTALIYTRGEPLSTQAMKIYLKGLGVPKADIDAKVKELEAKGNEIFARKAVPSEKCAPGFDWLRGKILPP